VNIVTSSLIEMKTLKKIHFKRKLSRLMIQHPCKLQYDT